jgi:chorismate mutase
MMAVSPSPGGYHQRCEFIPQFTPVTRRWSAERGKSVEIQDWRNKIDDLDVKIVQMISERAAAAQAIGDLKRKTDLPVYEPQREQDVFNHVKAVNPGPLADAEMLHVYERIIDVMRTLQRRDI